MTYNRSYDFKKYYNVLKWESTFTLELHAVKVTDYIKKFFKK